jgi:hypothetical protein
VAVRSATPEQEDTIKIKTLRSGRNQGKYLASGKKQREAPYSGRGQRKRWGGCRRKTNGCNTAGICKEPVTGVIACIVVTKLKRVTTALAKEPKEPCPSPTHCHGSANLNIARANISPGLPIEARPAWHAHAGLMV